MNYVKARLNTYSQVYALKDLIPPAFYMNFMNTSSDSAFLLTNIHLLAETISTVINGGSVERLPDYLSWLIERSIIEIDFLVR